MNKPEKKYPSEPVYFWQEVKEYMEEKYSINLDKFWGWIVDNCYPNNESTFFMNITPVENEDYEVDEDWVIEIGRLLRGEGFLDENFEGWFYAS